MQPWLSWMFLVPLQTSADTNDSAAVESGNSVQSDKSAGRLPPINQEAFKMEVYEICIKYKKKECNEVFNLEALQGRGSSLSHKGCFKASPQGDKHTSS